MQLTSKEKSLLEDNLSHEKICIAKYKAYAGQTQDPEIRNLFEQLSQKEQQHADSITQLLTDSGFPPQS